MPSYFKIQSNVHDKRAYWVGPQFTQGKRECWRRKWQPIPVFLPGKSRGWGNLVGYSPWSRKDLDTTERLNNKRECSEHDKGVSPTPFLPSISQSFHFLYWVLWISPMERQTGVLFFWTFLILVSSAWPCKSLLCLVNVCWQAWIPHTDGPFSPCRLSGLSPFLGETDAETMNFIVNCNWDFDADTFEGLSEEAKDFVSRLLVKEKRYPLLHITHDPFWWWPSIWML